MARGKRQVPQYRLEEPVTGLGVAQTLAGYRLVPPAEADRFPTAAAAQLAAQANAVDVVRVDA